MEHNLDMVGVAGSIPVVPTIQCHETAIHCAYSG
jgi:hypothetical protein